MHSREAVNMDQGNSTDEFPPDEMLRACVELTRAILGQSALAHFTSWWRLAGFPCREEMATYMEAYWRRYYGNKLPEFTINSLDSRDAAAGHGCYPTGNGYLYWSRGSMTSFDFYSIRYAYRFFTCPKTEPKTDSLYRCSRLTAYRCTSLVIT